MVVEREIAADQDFSDIVESGSGSTGAEVDYTVKADVQGLEPDSGYYCCFRTGARVSPVGVEFACASVSSPGGAELVVGLETADQFAPFAVTLVDDLRYTNVVDRGYIALSFTADQVSGEWRYISGCGHA